MCCWRVSENFCTCQKKKEIRKFASRFFSSIDPVCVWNKRTKAHRHEKKLEKTFSNNKSFLLICASRKVFFFLVSFYFIIINRSRQKNWETIFISKICPPLFIIRPAKKKTKKKTKKKIRWIVRFCNFCHFYFFRWSIATRIPYINFLIISLSVCVSLGWYPGGEPGGPPYFEFLFVLFSGVGKD